MNLLLLAVLGGIGLLIVLAAIILLRQSPAAALQQQLIELRERLDRLTISQQEVPRALANGSAEQMRALADVRERLAQLNEATRRLESLGQQVGEVHQLLQIPKLRGNLGEVMLEQLLAEVLPDGHYALQHGLSTGRVDAVIKLGGRMIPVDAKFPMESCRRMLDAGEGAEAERQRRAFLRSVCERIDEIASKYIRPAEDTYEFALMYIPAETVYYEAVVRDASLDGTESLLRYALERRVIPVSPQTFYAYLLVILHGLRGMKLEQRARHIQGELATLGRDCDAMLETLRRLGVHLSNAQKQYQEGERQGTLVRDRLERVAGWDNPERAPGSTHLPGVVASGLPPV